MATSSLLIIVTFLAGNAWGPLVTTQPFQNKEDCTTAMHAIAETILGAAKSNVNGKVIIGRDDASGLKIIAGVNQRVMASIKCN